MVSNTEVACEREIYSFHPVVLTPCYATVPTQGVGYLKSLEHRSFWWHRNNELWYLVSHAFCKRKLMPSVVTVSPWSAYLPPINSTRESSAGRMQPSCVSAPVMAVHQRLSPDPASIFHLDWNHIPWKYNSLGSWESLPDDCSLPESAIKQHSIRRLCVPSSTASSLASYKPENGTRTKNNQSQVSCPGRFTEAHLRRQRGNKTAWLSGSNCLLQGVKLKH